MSDKFTCIRVPDQKGFPGIGEWGEITREEAIEAIRKHADYLRNHVAVIDETPDEGFDIEVVRGSIVERHIKWIQKGKRN